MSSAQPRPAPLACLSCRNKHLKCDGRLPICARCADSKSECVFVRSRRGIRGRGRRQPDPSSISQHGCSSSSNVGRPHSNSNNHSVNLLQQQRQLPSPTGTEVRTQSTVPHLPSPATSNGAADDFIDVYYEYFHAAHPFVAPRAALVAGLVQLPPYLRAAMAYVASHYANPTNTALPDALDLGTLAHGPDSLYKVQALLLLALASFARLESPKGTAALMQAIESGRLLRLDREAYVQSQPFALQESCRRTWWELFVVATLVRSILNVNVPFDLAGCDLYLPGDCESYGRNVPQTELRTIQDMQNRFLSDIDVPWSGFAFKIEATMILRTVLETEKYAKGEGLRHVFDACQASISSWWLSLPTDKGLDNPSRDVDADECMFFALMVINMASLRINLPRSDLSPSWREATLCSPIEVQASARDASYHTKSALKAANTLSSLIASEGSSRLHTPCSACAIAFGTIVQLPAYLTEPDDTKTSNLKENIQLGLTYLKRMGEVWPMAFAVRSQLAQVASQVLATPRKRDSGFSQSLEDQHKASMGSIADAISGGSGSEHSYHHPPLHPAHSSSVSAATTTATHNIPRTMPSVPQDHYYTNNDHLNNTSTNTTDETKPPPGSQGDGWLVFARDQLIPGLNDHANPDSARYDMSVELEGEDSGWLRDLVNAPPPTMMMDFGDAMMNGGLAPFSLETPSSSAAAAWAEVV